MNWNKGLIVLAPILFFVAIMLGASVRTPMWLDEYTFYRLSSNFPDYSSTPDWFFNDRPEVFSQSIDWEKYEADYHELFELVYSTPIYTHPPLPVVIVSPLVKGLNWLADKEIIPHIEDEPGQIIVDGEVSPETRTEVITGILRIIPILLCAASMWLMFKVMNKKVGVGMYVFALPITFGVLLLNGAAFFYWDAFMIFFFALTLYLMECRPESKWKYLFACCLVNTKMFVGMAFLIPLVIKAVKDDKRKGWFMLLPLLSILPFYFATYFVTGDPLYLWNHYAAQIPIHNIIYSQFTPWSFFLVLLGLGIPFIVMMSAPVLWFWKKYPEYSLVLLIAIFYMWGGGLAVTHTAAIIYAGALSWPIVVYEFRLMERLREWVKAKA